MSYVFYRYFSTKIEYSADTYAIRCIKNKRKVSRLHLSFKYTIIYKTTIISLKFRDRYVAAYNNAVTLAAGLL